MNFKTTIKKIIKDIKRSIDNTFSEQRLLDAFQEISIVVLAIGILFIISKYFK
jgi:hypothetical protein